MIVDEFIQHDYQVIEELGHNLTGGRVTYKAISISTGEAVVIKQFQFLGGSWKETEYEAYEQELQVLRQLSYPGIPRYLASFETDKGFCLVQGYINAQSLAILRNWKLDEIKQIALSVLKILVYLQSQTPSIIHRDIKPENILVDRDLNVYLIDFGFARVSRGEIGISSMVKGTMGFMPPEQLFNRQLTTASDLYGLGATLICLLTGVKSVDIGTLMDENYQIHFRHLIPPMERGWISWLEKMVKPLVKERYQSAKKALYELTTIDVYQLPKVRLDPTKLELEAKTFQETLTHKLMITNPIPNTILSGRWEVAPHSSDPPHTPYDHSWISVFPRKFEGNNIECQIVFDTSQLVDSSYYERQLILHINSFPEHYTIPIKLKTACIAKLLKINYFSIGISFFYISALCFFMFDLGIVLIPFFVVVIFYLPILFYYQSQTVNNIPSKEARTIILLTTGLAISVGAWIKFLLNSKFLSALEVTGWWWWGVISLSLATLITMSYLWYQKAIANPKKYNQMIRQYKINKSQLIQP